MMDIIYMSFIGLSVLCGLIFLKKSSHIAYKLLLIFLIVTLSNEITCFFVKQNHDQTQVYYNIYYYFRFPFIGLAFHTIFFNKNKFISYFIISFYLLSILL